MIACICRGSLLAARSKVVAGRRMTGFNDNGSYPELVVQPDAEVAGAIWVQDAQVVVDHNLVTLPHPRYSAAFSSAIVEALRGRISEARDPLMSNRDDVPALPSKVSVAISINGNLRELIFFHGPLFSTSFARNFSSPARRRGAIMGSVVPALCSSMACASIRALLLRS